MIFNRADKIHIFSVSILKGFVLLWVSFFFKWNFVFWMCAHGCVETKGTHKMWLSTLIFEGLFGWSEAG